MTLETFNKFMVGAASEGRVVIVRPPMGPISNADALLLAAWLVAIASRDGSADFTAILDEVQST